MRKTILTFIFISLSCICSLAQNKENLPCPTITVIGASGLVTAGDDITFTVSIDSSQKIEYEWTVSQGEISSGQNSFAITVSTTHDMSGSNVTATVEIKGLPENCSKTNSETAVIKEGCGLPIQIDEYGKLSFNEEKARLANLVSELKKKPDFGAVFIDYSPKNSNYKLYKERISKIKKYLIEEQNISPERLEFVFGGYGDYLTIIYLPPIEAVSAIKSN